MTDTTDMTRGVYRRLYSGFTTSKRFSALSLEAESTFWRLNAVADDYGNLPGDPVLIRAMGMPYRQWSDEQIQRAVDELLEAKLIATYSVNSEPYVHINDFENRQPSGLNGRRVRRYPVPSGHELVNPGESGGIRKNPGESRSTITNTNTTTNTTTTTTSVDDDAAGGRGAVEAVCGRMGMTPKQQRAVALLEGVSAGHVVSLWAEASSDPSVRSAGRVVASRLDSVGLSGVPPLTPHAVVAAVKADIVYRVAGVDVQGKALKRNDLGVYLDGKALATATDLKAWAVALA